MYTSATEVSRSALKTAFVYLLALILCALVGAIYEVFSHGVYSPYMVYAFAFPLLGGALPFTVIGLFRPVWCPSAALRSVYHSGIATLTLGSFINGAMEIYGTTNRLVSVYWYAGAALVLGSLLLFSIRLVCQRGMNPFQRQR